MRLFMSLNSPYARKVRLLIRMLPDLRQIEEIEVNPRDEGTAFRALAPAARIPVLALDDGTALCESDLIAAHLDAAFGKGALVAPVLAHPARTALLGLANTMMDQGMAARVAAQLQPGPDREAALEKHLSAVRRIGQALDDWAPVISAAPDYADMALICALDWISLRHPDVRPKQTWPALGAFAQGIADHPAVAATVPPG